MRRFRRNQQGLTLIELLIVVAILGILAAIILPKIQNYQAAKHQKNASARAPAAAKPEIMGPWPPIDTNVAPVAGDSMLRKNYYVILDGSGSMRDQSCSGNQPKSEAAADSLRDFFATIPAEANVGLLVFDAAGFTERVPLGVGNRPQLQTALNGVRPEGGTPLSRAIDAGYQALTRQASRQLGYGEYHLVVVTDGEASPGYDPTYTVNSIIDGSAIVIHTIGFCIDEGHSLNQPGRTLYSSVQDAQSLSRELKAVLAEAESFDVSQFK